jgi:hypothetical protein
MVRGFLQAWQRRDEGTAMEVTAGDIEVRLFPALLGATVFHARVLPCMESASGQSGGEHGFIARYGDEERLSAASIRSSRLST